MKINRGVYTSKHMEILFFYPDNSPGTDAVPLSKKFNSNDEALPFNKSEVAWKPLIITSIVCNNAFQVSVGCMEHDDVIKWKYFPPYWPFVRRNYRWTVVSPYKGQWLGALMLSFICAKTNGWANNRDAGDLRRYRDFDVTVMGFGRNCNLRVLIIGILMS